MHLFIMLLILNHLWRQVVESSTDGGSSVCMVVLVEQQSQ